MKAPLYDLGMVIMRQSWHDVSFLHWRHDPAVVRPLVPRGRELDLYDGAAWIGLVPFYIMGLTLPFAPPVPYLSNFPETNVRTYAVDRHGGRGVWFFSLDAARVLGVVGARGGDALPYFWSKKRVACDGKTARYSSERLHRPRASSEVEVSVGDRIDAPSELELFLTMRFRLYAERAGMLWKADIEHPPWPLQRAKVVRLQDTLVEAAALPKPAGEALTHY